MLRYLCCALLCLSVVSAQDDPNSVVSYDEKYVEGVNAYAREKWKTCILFFRQAMDEFSRLEETRVKCFDKCLQEEVNIPHDYSDNSELHFFHTVFQRKHCIAECEENKFGILSKGGVPEGIFEKLRKREGLNYLQKALYQDGQTKEAAQVCAQYAYFNPVNQHIRLNMAFYKKQKEVTAEDQQPQQTFKYRQLYEEGHRQYYAEEWQEMVDSFEKALTEFYKEVEHCRTMCMGPLQYGNSFGFAQALTELHANVVICEAKCVDKLGTFRSHQQEKFFGSFFHYLQYGYYFLNQSIKAVQASATQVRLEPHSEDAKKNSVFYKQRPGISSKDFKLREDVLPEIFKQESIEKYFKLVNNLSGQLAKAIRDEVWGMNEEGGGQDHEWLEEDFKNHPLVMLEHSTDDDKDSSEPVVVQTSKDLGGPERMLVDQLLTREQCDRLIHLATYGKEGDGYGRKSPHTQREKFVGLHILDAAKKAVNGEFHPSLPWLYLNASRKSKDMVAKVFNLNTPLYFSYTHLVCRSSKDGMQDDRNDLSHPVHSDNCILDEVTGECNKVPPAYTWRDYSAILYVSDPEEFEGGQFFFARSSHDLSPDVEVEPKCGRLVGFSAGKENMHGVKAVTKGQRCAVALWFTLDPDYNEAAFDEAENMLTTHTVV